MANKSNRKTKMTASSFEALPDAEKNRILAEIESVSPAQRLAESRPLTAKERAQFEAFRQQVIKRGAGRPKVGQGSKVISLSVEKGFLKRVDAYAKRMRMKRSELFLKSVREKIGAWPRPDEVSKC
ncbi:MAG TPA: hypothetical protein VLJ39_02100 [Tepidisphaeraceae bacterium]|jgi:hypothetical protein|nr:hypothetical protein [Tepidisphaeraceae bacterium]